MCRVLSETDLKKANKSGFVPNLNVPNLNFHYLKWMVDRTDSHAYKTHPSLYFEIDML